MICHKRKIICLQVPKNASSTVGYALKKNGLENLPLHDKKLGHSTLLDIKQMKDYDKISNYKILAVIRNPQDRSKSLYKMFHKYFTEYGYSIEFMKKSIWFEKQFNYVDQNTKIIRFESLWSDLNNEIPNFRSFPMITINSSKIDIDVPHEFMLLCREYFKYDFIIYN